MNKIISEEIDILRGIAALGVIVGHALYSSHKVLNGAFWVWIFFIVSGYLQGYSFFANKYAFSKEGLISFWKNRALRIMPLYVLALCLGLVLKIFLLNEAVNPWGVFKQFVTLTNNIDLLGPLWSVSAEIHFYALLVLLIWMMRRWAPLELALFLGVMSLFLMIMSGSLFGDMLQSRSVWGNLLFFCVGLYAARYARIPHQGGVWLKFFLVLMTIMCAAWVHVFYNSFFWGGGGMLIAILVALPVVTLESERNWLHQLLAPFRWVGRYCYGVYVYAALVNVYLHEVLRWPLGVNFLLVNLFWGVLLAVLSYYVFERWFLLAKDKPGVG